MTEWMYFNKDEFKCPHCDRNKIETDFLDMLDAARKDAGVPFVITSGYRCPIHNKTVGGRTNSSHLKGCAADISCTNDEHRMKIMVALIRTGFHRIGVRQDFIHVDNDLDKNPVRLWVY